MSQSFTRYAIIGMVLIGFSAVVYACGRATDTTRGTTRLEKLSVGAMARMDFTFKGQKAPSDTFLAPDGAKISLEDFEGKTILVNVWATWCSPCEREMPSLAALQTAKSEEAFQVIPLSIDEIEERKFATGQLKKLSGGALEFYQAETLGITYSLGVTGFPTTILYDDKGYEIARYLGDTDWSGYEAIAFIDAAQAMR